MSVSIEIIKDEATPKLRVMAERTPVEFRRALYRGGSVIERGVKALMSGPVLRARSNRLRGSVHTEVRGNEAAVGSNVVYAPVHEFGAVIVPKRAQALVFQTDDGRWHRVRRVTIPARRPFARSLQENWAKVLQVFQQAVEAIIR